jgi:hypothetical protein
LALRNCYVNKEQTGFKELFTDYRPFYTVNFFTLYVKEIKIAIWDAELVFSTGLKSGGTPRGSYGDQQGLLFYVGAKGGY